MTVIYVEQLNKSYRRRLPVADGAPWPQRLRDRWRPSFESKPAVTNLSFSIESGEKIAFIGPNGAGKSTTLKMLTGILYPTDGYAEVAGFIPWQERQELSHYIGIVFGQRSQLWSNLSVQDGLLLLGRLYDMNRPDIVHRIHELSEVFNLSDLLAQPVRSLSLGQRMRAELAASLIHRPEILFLDEPTIGLDITSKTLLRQHLNHLTATEGVTILLTSHDVGDIEEIADRVMVINHGELVFDDSLAALNQNYLTHKLVRLHFTQPVSQNEMQLLMPLGVSLQSLGDRQAEVSIDLARTNVPKVLGKLLAQLPVHDVTVDNPPLEQIIQTIYQQPKSVGMAGGAAGAGDLADQPATTVYDAGHGHA
jgi:ABC-2 type transport system ATP-binding protein